MRLLVAGDRNWSDHYYGVVLFFIRALHNAQNITCIIEGEADGVDKLARRAGEELGILIDPYPAQWKRYGRAAGPIRNQRQLDEGKPDRVLVFHHDLTKSKGTADMVRRALKAGVPVWWCDGRKMIPFAGFKKY